jgi:hypothetical protein
MDRALTVRTVRHFMPLPIFQVKGAPQSDHPGNIFRVEKHIYPRGSVSWSDAKGLYYIHVVDKVWHETRLRKLHAQIRRAC